ncbi:phosphoribosylaminoimidazolesuccinocarboxamide synthase [Helcococcus kunzii]|uniref:phosphoribosylaminoimidazolesuccinocarboxamide synthase n=1 Tax=Helcococcus kunzii ATCC 51366 TaxID=883114 RepID=H3NMF3_9FIRM|nr:phosphoribosylaminoimidazolesuccinocarboxamide synthase [Helcococcus kunzii]EHR35039.1 phosphoribosylaminoimidazolesuccinocarboxamide synthase [Helcococcus kunzii ATCC 51366]QUY64465.1 phosphoribosylaminoimidazolesuccinocarboxamide synthase [Helcococcus kunzii]QZO76876.1 phosphoribosylaminoimidazolesuccinocarboxamide synthase [Helcococcus kunzii]
MELKYKGKTKDVYELENGNILLKFKDDVTGKDGKFDPGENQVGLTIDGSGRAGLSLTKYFFERLKDKGIKTHYIDCDIDNQTMEVVKAKPFGHGLEFICRYKAVGSFYRRYKKYVKEGQELDAFVEITIKDDEAGDPVISKEALSQLNIVTNEQYDELVKQTKLISNEIKSILEEDNIELYDIKLELGLTDSGEILLIDEISGGNMRAYKDDVYILPIELYDLVLGKK